MWYQAVGSIAEWPRCSHVEFDKIVGAALREAFGLVEREA
jgi:hypothetical protein